jgi:septum formation protein
MAERAGLATDRPPLILASGSQRRRWLLEQIGVCFEALAVDIEERQRGGELPALFAQRMADEKAATAGARRTEAWVLAADTVVALDDIALGKPRDAEEAATMLTRLSGREHLVYTGVVLLRPTGVPAERAVVATRVSFRSLSAAEIRAYVASGEPLDKAGAYAIQCAGAHLVDRVEGSYTNVIGLPLAEVATWLRAWQIL